jgi:hypothetical protein
MKTAGSTDWRNHLLPLAVLGLAAWQGAAGLVAAWGNDLYARGAPWAFGLWLATAVLARPRGSESRPLVWVAVSLLCCVAASISGLQVMNHLALAIAVPALLGFSLPGLAVIASAAVWLPASGWFISRWITGGLSGWERPLAALACGFAILACGFLKPASRS